MDSEAFRWSHFVPLYTGEVPGRRKSRKSATDPKHYRNHTTRNTGYWPISSNKLGPRWVGCRRFPPMQKGKCRPADDLSEFGVNGCVETHEKEDVGGVDEVLVEELH